ncbi:MAG: carboxypeptidase-like regulatory domain-containing protein, partial [Hymenobacter sp.]|nr:carboxypeptidase-like regulatory domain-containing protein [Hymenobacter sp.]
MQQRLLLLFLLIIASSGVVRAQTSALSGRIVDGASQVPLIGANVLVRGLAADSAKSGAAADADGNFTVAGLAAGRYELTISFLGYQTLRRPFALAAGQPLALGTLALGTGGVVLKGVEVVGRAAAAVQKGDTSQFNAGSF